MFEEDIFRMGDPTAFSELFERSMEGVISYDCIRIDIFLSKDMQPDEITSVSAKAYKGNKETFTASFPCFERRDLPKLISREFAYLGRKESSNVKYILETHGELDVNDGGVTLN